MEPEHLYELIQSRRTVKPAAFSTRVIEPSVVEALLECANWAPTHGKTEPWRFKVYVGKGLIHLSQILPRLYKLSVPEHQFRAEKEDKLRMAPLQSSHAVAVVMRRHADSGIPEVEEIEAVACAVQNLLLAARIHGIGSFWSTGDLIYNGYAPKYFNLTPQERLMGIVYLGYPAGAFPEGSRTPIMDKVEWIDG